MTPPLITVGMPVYNCAALIDAAIGHILGQTYPNFELLISDNASTDQTPDICRAYAARDQRIRYIRQPVNLGAMTNFQFVLRNATSEYFMWAAADDLRSSDFIQVNTEFLQSHPDYIASISPARVSGGAFDPIQMGDGSVDDDDANQRVLALFRTWHANARFYSVFRRRQVLTWPQLHELNFLGFDWTLFTHLVSQGKTHRASEGWIEFGTKGISRASDIFSLYRKRWTHWVLPFQTVTADAFAHLEHPTPEALLALGYRLARLNYKAARMQVGNWLRSKGLR